MKFKPTTYAKIEQVLKEIQYPEIEAGKTYYLNSPSGGRVERPVIEVTNGMVLYLKPSGFSTCPLKTFQRLYQQYGTEETQ